jgi:hypothetical protein
VLLSYMPRTNRWTSMAKSDSDSGSLWQDQPELPTQMVGLDRLQSKIKRSSQAEGPTKDTSETLLSTHQKMSAETTT